MKFSSLISWLFLLMAVPVSAQLTPRHWSVTYDRFNACSPELVQIGTLDVPDPGEHFNNRWSIGCECLDRDYSFFPGYADYLPELGVAYARIQSGWARCEKEKGVYDFDWLDEIVDGIISKGLKPWMTLCYGNPNYGSGHDLGALVFEDDDTMKGWVKYVEAVVKHFKDRVVMYEVWNEPNHMDNVKRPEAYANLYVNTVKAIRKADKDVEIAGLSLSWFPRWEFQTKVLDIIKEKGLLETLDYVTFHPYYHNPDRANRQIEYLDSLVKSYSSDIQLYQGEAGCPSRLEYTHALRYIEWTECSQAKWIARRMANDFLYDFPSNIFTIVDHTYPDMQQSFGLLRSSIKGEVIYKRPAFHTVRHMAALLTEDLKAVPMTAEANIAREVSAVGLVKHGKVIGAMVWMSDETPSSDLKWENVSLTIKNLHIEYPVMVDPVTGKVYNLNVMYGAYAGGDQNFEDFPLTDYPVLIMEHSEVKMTPTADYNYFKSIF